MLSAFPLCIKGWLYVLENNDGSPIGKSLTGVLNSSWEERFCILMENDSTLYIYNEEPKPEDFPISDHISEFRMDKEVCLTNICESCNNLDEMSSIGSRHFDSDKNASNSSLNQNLSSKKQSKNSSLYGGGRLFWKAKSSTKINSIGKENIIENNCQTKTVSTLKRSQSLSRLIRKKSEDKNIESKSPTQHNNNKKSNNHYMTQSTGDLTMSKCHAQRLSEHRFKKDSNISDVHPSLINERQHCFSITCASYVYSDFPNNTTSYVPRGSVDSCTKSITNNNTTGGFNNNNFVERFLVFSARSTLEKLCWMKRFQKTSQPNLENEVRYNNSLKLTIFESKYLSSQKRRYYCEIYLNKVLYAKTTVKTSNNDGSVFWAEDLVLDNLPNSNLKTLTISLFKEPDHMKDSKKRKKKHNQCVGSTFFNLIDLSSNNNDLQSWFNLKTTDIIQTDSSVQLRVKVRYQSLRILRFESYSQLTQLATTNHIELINFLEQNLPIKLKEEIAICLVNIHEKKGTIIEFLTNLITEEISDTENSSMSLRANTIVTKIIESHMKLVGSNYLHNMLCGLIREIMSHNVSLEVDPMKIETSNEDKNKMILDNQHKLKGYLKKIWDTIFSQKEFPIQLKAIFTGWRKKLESRGKNEDDVKRISGHCDLIVSGCIFLRLLCPAILSPHLFGLVSHFSEKPFVQRTLTLIAKSLQSLANFSKFGEKENYMLFLNVLFDEEMPRMHTFLRAISTPDPLETPDDTQDNQLILNNEIQYYAHTIDFSVEMARLHSCLSSDTIKDRLEKSPKIDSSVFSLPNIIFEISQAIKTSKKTNQNSDSGSASIGPSSSNHGGRRTSLGRLNMASSTSSINSNHHNNISNFNRRESPPRLGSPISQSISSVNPVSDYMSHNDDIWQKRPDNNQTNNKLENPQMSSLPTVSYSTKSQYNAYSKNQISMVIPTTHRANYKTNENKSNLIAGNNSNLMAKRTYDQKVPKYKSISSSYNSNNHRKLNSQVEIQPKKSVIKPQSDIRKLSDATHHSTSDARKLLKPQSQHHKPDIKLINMNHSSNKFKPNIINDNIMGYYYFENPLYDSLENLTNITDNPSNVDQFFTTRMKMKDLREHIGKDEDGAKPSDFMKLSEMKRELNILSSAIQIDQMYDVKQLKSLLSRGEAGQTLWGSNIITTSSSTSELGNSKRSVRSSSKGNINVSLHDFVNETNYPDNILDQVISNITSDGAGLDIIQDNLRRQKIRKGKSLNKLHQTTINHTSTPPNAIVTTSHSSSSRTPNNNNNNLHQSNYAYYRKLPVQQIELHSPNSNLSLTSSSNNNSTNNNNNNNNDSSPLHSLSMQSHSSNCSIRSGLI